MRDEILTGWLCIARLHFEDEDSTFQIPCCVQRALVERGWATIEEEAPGEKRMFITDDGFRVTDLNAPEWGIDSLAQCSEEGP